MCIVVTMQDPALAFAKKGYHVLLEKPMAVSYNISFILQAPVEWYGQPLSAAATLLSSILVSRLGSSRCELWILCQFVIALVQPPGWA